MKIYAIKNKTSNLVYIGSTKAKYLSSRFNQHKAHKTTKALEIIQCPTAYIELIEECNDDERIEKERYCIEHTENCINKQIPGRKWDEWRKSNKDQYNDYMKKYMKEKYWKNKILS